MSYIGNQAQDVLTDLQTQTIINAVAGNTLSTSLINLIGDGVTTTFALGFTPVSPTNVIAVVNGSTFAPNIDFTISGANIIFTVAPNTLADISVRAIATKSSISDTVSKSDITNSANNTLGAGLVGQSNGLVYSTNTVGGRLQQGTMFSDSFVDYVVSGLLSPVSATLTSIMAAGSAYVIGLRIQLLTSSTTYTASTDTYVDLLSNGTLAYLSVVNNAAAPTVSTNSLRLQKVITSATAVTSVVQLASVGFQVNRLLYELSVTGIVANTTGTQATATQLFAQTNRVDTVTVRGSGVKLPASAAGLEITIINNTNLGIQVFGAGTDIINGLVSTVGVYQPPNSTDTYWCAGAGFWHAEVGFGYSGGLGTETSQDSITAFAGGGQTNATQITTQTNRITTVVTAGDSIKLPPSAPGLELTIVNHGGNPVQIFGTGTDTVNDSPTATGVSQLSNSTVIYFCVSSGAWYTDGIATGFSGGYQTLSYVNGLVAFAGGGQTGATLLSQMTNRISTVATLGDSVKLPPSASGMSLTVINTGANTMNVFPSGTELVNGISTVSQITNSIVLYICAIAGQWFAVGVGSGFINSLPTVSASNGLTATPSGTQSTALLLTSVINRVTVVAIANDAIKLQPSFGGLQITVTNATNNSMNIYPNTGDSINSLVANVVYPLAGNKTVSFTSAAVGFWHAVLSA